MKLIRLPFLLMCCFLVNAFQVNAQCSITNLNITSINCTPNAFNAANNDYTYCGSFTASSTSGNYEFATSHQANIPVTAMALGLAKDGLISFCVEILDVSYIPEGFTVGEQGNPACGASFAGGPPAVCTARSACSLSGLSISNVCCDGSGGLRVIGSFTAANGSGNYRVQVDGLPQGGFPGPSQMVNIPSSSMSGTVNFDVVLASFDYTNIGSGIYISDNFLNCFTPFGQMPPASAAACTSCPAPAVATAPIPTMSQWGLLIFGLLTLNLGLIFLYKKQSQFIK